ncbi:MAG: response regulator [Anaerolineaceae bacterium]|nr:response regulator [Anaerolineaceae bacterium]
MTTMQPSKVILVEDDATMQAVLRTLLEIEGFTVALAPDRKGQHELVQFIKTENPDMVLIDVHLRETSGIEVLRELREDAAFASTRVIMTSGLDAKDKCLAAGANSFLMKPFMPDELISKLRG